MASCLVASRRGAAGIVAALFLVTVVVLASNAAIWFYGAQANLYAQFRNVQQLRQQTRLEEFQVTRVLVSSTQPELTVTIQNNGPVTIHIVDAIITSRSDVPVWHRIYQVSYYINPGSNNTSVGQTINPVNPTLNSANTYTLTFVTERGNAVTVTYRPTQLVGNFAKFANVGFLSVNFYQTSEQYTSQAQGTPISAWTLSASLACNQQPIWWVWFINHAQADAYILHWSQVQMWLVGGGVGGGGTARDFYIVASSSTPGNLVAYSDNSIKVPKSLVGDWVAGGISTVAEFGATAGGGTTPNDLAGCSIGASYNFAIEISYTVGLNGPQYNELIFYAGSVVTTA